MVDCLWKRNGSWDPVDEKTDAIGAAMKPLKYLGMREPTTAKKATAALLKTFKEYPDATREMVRVSLGWYDKLAAEMFALVVFVSDGLVQVIEGEKATAPAARFFRIARELPLELQMVLCYCFAGSPKSLIPGKESEQAFKYLALRL